MHNFKTNHPRYNMKRYDGGFILLSESYQDHGKPGEFNKEQGTRGLALGDLHQALTSRLEWGEGQVCADM